MKIQDFLDHHRIAGNPFAEEDAQNDTVFKRTCLESTFHPAWANWPNQRSTLACTLPPAPITVIRPG